VEIAAVAAPMAAHGPSMPEVAALILAEVAASTCEATAFCSSDRDA
jgi:hypothetical protein